MDWYEEDFGNSDEEILLYISKYLPSGIAEDIRKNTSDWEIDYLTYNWALNDLQE